jgi:hypothetical protein
VENLRLIRTDTQDKEKDILILNINANKMLVPCQPQPINWAIAKIKCMKPQIGHVLSIWIPKHLKRYAEEEIFLFTDVNAVLLLTIANHQLEGVLLAVW